jgi:hypothetical protein
VFLQFYSLYTLGYLYILPNNMDSLLHLPSKFFSVVFGLFFVIQPSKQGGLA